jgi:hypothetical protein
MFNTLATIYVAGVIVGLLVMRDRWAARLLTAALWPLGLLALAVVTVTLVAASAYLWPVPVIGSAAVVGAIIWFLV